LLEPVANRIDEIFRAESAPTITRPEKAFFAQTAKDMIEMIAFTRWLGIGAVLGVLGLVANALLLAARSRVREGAILQTVGFPQRAIGILVLFEGMLLGLAGGILGSGGAYAFLGWRRFTFGNEGLTLAFSPSLGVTLAGVGVALVLAVLASLWPAAEAARRPIVQSLREG
ncbi:MAG: FtsX-like permease family protein, partial [Verrucomicrobia bacterium]|nr:FtsX-like permease family protein [Verrucomicrobiota bacterium]